MPKILFVAALSILQILLYLFYLKRTSVLHLTMCRKLISLTARNKIQKYLSSAAGEIATALETSLGGLAFN